MPWCICMILSAQEQNVPRLFCNPQKYRFVWEKEGRTTQYIVKDCGINKTLIHISGRICWSLTFVVFDIRSFTPSSSVALLWPWQGNINLRLKTPFSGRLSSVIVALALRFFLPHFMPLTGHGLGQIIKFSSLRPPPPQSDLFQATLNLSNYFYLSNNYLWCTYIPSTYSRRE